MKAKIRNLGDLVYALSQLSELDLYRSPLIAGADEPGLEITEMVITEEDLLQSRFDPDDIGSESELKSLHGEKFDRQDYNVIEPAGKLYFYVDKP